VAEHRPDRAPGATPPSTATLLESLGGPLGVAESTAPSAAFVIAYTASGQETRTALIVAVVLGVLAAVGRIVRGQSPQYALAGLAGLALSAYVVAKSGKAANFFLPGLLANVGYGLAYLISIVVRWPLLGVILGVAGGSGMSWREDPEKVRAFARASWVWVVLFALRVAVQLPLYLADAVVALGVARIAMGIPLFAIGIWLSWLLLRGTPAADMPLLQPRHDRRPEREGDELR
jgi:hypothetical protein